jgi:hypothetical protein
MAQLIDGIDIAATFEELEDSYMRGRPNVLHTANVRDAVRMRRRGELVV